jgi:hypothetical protein
MKWIVSVDLGQQADPTAIAVLEVVTRRDAVDAQYLDPRGELAKLVSNSWFVKEGARNGRLIDRPLRVDVRYLERLPLRMAYPDQIAHLGALLRRPPLATARPALVVDQTGVGRPVVDLLRRAGLRPIGVTITSGDRAAVDWTHGPDAEWHVAKLLLVSTLQAALNEHTLRIAKTLPDARAFVEELMDFRATIGEATGYTSFGAREGAHDDLVLAVALGLWWATRTAHAATTHAVHI